MNLLLRIWWLIRGDGPEVCDKLGEHMWGRWYGVWSSKPGGDWDETILLRKHKCIRCGWFELRR